MVSSFIITALVWGGERFLRILGGSANCWFAVLLVPLSILVYVNCYVVVDRAVFERLRVLTNLQFLWVYFGSAVRGQSSAPLCVINSHLLLAKGVGCNLTSRCERSDSFWSNFYGGHDVSQSFFILFIGHRVLPCVHQFSLFSTYQVIFYDGALNVVLVRLSPSTRLQIVLNGLLNYFADSCSVHFLLISSIIFCLFRIRAVTLVDHL